MRIRSLEVRSAGPIKRVAVENLADVVVFAGPNGVGKTSLNNAILGFAQNPSPRDDLWLLVAATSDDEQNVWGKRELDTRTADDCSRLRSFLQRNKKRSKYTGSFLNFDSDRAIRNIAPFNFGWDITNPMDEDVGWGMGFTPMSNRYNDVRHSLYRLVESQKRQVADEAFQRRAAGEASMRLDFPDLLGPFKDAFWQLLAPKALLEVNTKEQQIYYEYQDQRFQLDQLSSGEREVVNIVFDFILRGPSHSVIVFDEPELHLHPELSYRLLQTLSAVGTSNQFLFSTHSPEIISASLENTVVFVTPPKGAEDNQALVVHKDDATQKALQTLGQSIGVISLGKKLVLIEGEESSLDKQTYGAILRSQFPEFVLVPVGGKSVLRSFEEVQTGVLDRTIWGVQFFLLCDRDATNLLGPKALAAAANSKLKQLPRYHLENYFLDADVLASVFETMEVADSWLRSPAAIDEKLRTIAKSVVPYATALAVNATVRERVGNVSFMPKQLDALTSGNQVAEAIAFRLSDESERVRQGLNETTMREAAIAEFNRLDAAVTTGGDVWKRDIPGRVILNRFCSAQGVNIQPGRLKQLYIGAAAGTQTFEEIVAIFEGFRNSAA